MLEISYQMTSVLEKSIGNQYSDCPAGSRVLPDLEERNLPAFEINILLLLVSSFLILHFKTEGCVHAAKSLLGKNSWLNFSKD